MTTMNMFAEMTAALEDGAARLWHSATYRLEASLSYGLERCWAVGVSPTSNAIALGCDDGVALVRGAGEGAEGRGQERAAHRGAALPRRHHQPIPDPHRRPCVGCQCAQQAGGGEQGVAAGHFFAKV